MIKDILLIDNYDSFTYNLLHYLEELGAVVNVVRNDAKTVSEVLAMKPKAIVISPGPCDPDKSGICLDLIKQTAENTPILGVCLGHQAIVQAFGGHIIRAPKPMHGKIGTISTTQQHLFTKLPKQFDVTRYHSLIAERETLPECFDITAETEDGIIMGVSHKEYLVHGIQFHPESIASEHGHALLKHFLECA